MRNELRLRELNELRTALKEARGDFWQIGKDLNELLCREQDYLDPEVNQALKHFVACLLDRGEKPDAR